MYHAGSGGVKAGESALFLRALQDLRGAARIKSAVAEISREVLIWRERFDFTPQKKAKQEGLTMWTFSALEYTRPDIEAMKREYQRAIERFEQADGYEEAKAALLAQEAIIKRMTTAMTIVSIRNTMDTADAFYDEENMFFHREAAQFVPLQKRAGEALLGGRFRAELEKEYGRELFKKLEIRVKTQSEAIVPDLIEESELSEEYKKIVAACQADFMGESCNFYGLLKHMESHERDVRRAAFLAWAKLYEGVSDKLDAVFDKLIAVRLRIAEKLGFASYADLAYLNMGRADYTAKDVEQFRRQVREVIVPAVGRLREKQAARIGVDKLRYFDEAFMFPDGNADPIGTEAEQVDAARRMYAELSPETGVFFDFMVEHGLFDLSTRQGKHLGGYCTVLADYKAPFIFSNFNATAEDVGVLTHEAGHAFAFFESLRSQPLMEYMDSTSEVCEIHSMTMEHFTYPWLNSFFGEENVDKAKYANLSGALSAIPYLVAVDEFQHRVYEKPDRTAMERRALWREIEQAYMPWRDYDGVPFLAEGGFWMQKQHIFLYPFYYIDYALAQVGAFELYGRMKENREAAWADYLRLCKAGGSRGYFELLDLTNLKNPFTPGAVRAAVDHVIDELGVQ